MNRPNLINEAPEDRQERLRIAAQLINDAIHPLWNLGRFSVLGWRVFDGGIEVATLATSLLLKLCKTADQYSSGARQMDDPRYQQACEIPGVHSSQITLPDSIGSGPGLIPPSLVNSVITRYSVTKTLHRAVGLFDIVGFSKNDPIEQVAQLNSLEYSINIAHKRLRDIGLQINLARSTTGDGFYVWNRDTGLRADLASYLLVMLALADNAISRERYGPELAPLLRVCFSVGSHYSYYQVEGLNPRGYDYIVGEVTISLARMIDRCLPGQILMGEFERPVAKGASMMNTIGFVEQATHLLQRLKGMELSGGDIQNLSCYLTGEQIAPGCFNISRLRIRDKHGFPHHAYNQKMNIVLAPRIAGGPGANLYLGMQQEAMKNCGAASVIGGEMARSGEDENPPPVRDTAAASARMNQRE
ncbi:MAG TPA: hypothetical protein DCO82_01895 [Alphaproteobacteria bacterium]|jgi:hypothetical protein|nr:hypothetical protein [Alphaproteobacteria bacterium]